jgi:hypothetical protein
MAFHIAFRYAGSRLALSVEERLSPAIADALLDS